MTGNTGIIVAFVVYMALMLGIGVLCYKKSNSLSDYLLGGRGLNSWVAAMSAQASDMSGWLLMGLPGAVYAFGTGQIWIAVGLGIGTVLNWSIVASRLRRYTIKAGDSLTLPEYFENRFRDKSRVLRMASAVFIIIFFTVYSASAFVSGGKLFSTVFGIDYQVALLIGVLIILAYTFLGGFLAVCWTDFVQGLLMLVAILAVPILACMAVGGVSEVGEALNGVSPTFLDPLKETNGQNTSFISIISQLAWALGYFGMPHILVRFMAIKDQRSVKKSRIIAIVWVIISLTCAVFVGIIGRAFVTGLYDPANGVADQESIFIRTIQKLFIEPGAFVPVAIIGGLFLCGILAAIMSTADSQLLVTASSLSSDIYKVAIDKKASDKKLLWVSRIAVLAVAVVAYFIARDPKSSIMDLVSNAWSGFGSTFGPLVLFSLFWKKTTRSGALAGMIGGGLTVIIWDYIPMMPGADGLVNLGVGTGLYSIIPGFLISSLLIVVFSLVGKGPSQDMVEEFQEVALNTGDS